MDDKQLDMIMKQFALVNELIRLNQKEMELIDGKVEINNEIALRLENNMGIELSYLRKQVNINEEMLRRLNETLGRLAYDYQKMSSALLEKQDAAHPNASPNPKNKVIKPKISKMWSGSPPTYT